MHCSIPGAKDVDPCQVIGFRLFGWLWRPTTVGGSHLLARNDVRILSVLNSGEFGVIHVELMRLLRIPTDGRVIDFHELVGHIRCFDGNSLFQNIIRGHPKRFSFEKVGGVRFARRIGQLRRLAV
eukprot:1326260-Amorphochlora_amoeboformis.AAC.2